jgi:hypothetical protein
MLSRDMASRDMLDWVTGICISTPAGLKNMPGHGGNVILALIIFDDSR